MKTNGAALDEQFDELIEDGEVAWQSNLRAAKALDIYADEPEGLRELEVVVSGLDLLIGDLEAFKNVAENVERQALRTVRQT